MAKRKNKKNNLKLILTASALVLSVLGVILFLATDSVKIVTKIGNKEVLNSTFTGIQATFGYEDVLYFSFMALLPVIFVLGGIILSLLGLNNKLLSFIGGGLFIAAAVFFFIVPQFVSFNETAKGLTDFVGNLTGIKTSFEAVSGVYLGATFSGVAGLLTIGSSL